ncbi:hypothetical protein C1H46_012524 [Malus baccata]|uniref:Uncharacterized protein n=1 Tax=Malus baccata TaxID=106549 RepID=A0A540MU54_MALBA|nr:hypothetical protein C1H46_012524 [Malus baccata]
MGMVTVLRTKVNIYAITVGEEVVARKIMEGTHGSSEINLFCQTMALQPLTRQHRA